MSYDEMNEYSELKIKYKRLKDRIRVLHWKDEFDATCPYCEAEISAIMYLNTEELECDECGKEFWVEIQGIPRLHTYKKE